LICQTAEDLGEDGFLYCALAYLGCPVGVALRAVAREKFNVEVHVDLLTASHFASS